MATTQAMRKTVRKSFKYVKKHMRSRWLRSRINHDMDEVATEILCLYPELNPDSQIETAAAINYYVNVVIDHESRNFESTPRNLRRPEECWDIGAGNCQEKCLLTASLLASIGGYSVRTMSFNHESKSVGHLILEIKFPYHPQEVCNTLSNFYERSKRTRPYSDSFGFHNNTEKTHTWAVADNGTPYFGDLSHLYALDYVELPASGGWDYHGLESIIEVV